MLMLHMDIKDKKEDDHHTFTVLIFSLDFRDRKVTDLGVVY